LWLTLFPILQAEANNKSGWLVDRTIHHQALQLIHEMGSTGMTQTELAKKMGI